MVKMLLTYLTLMECCLRDNFVCSSQVSESEDQVSRRKEQIEICDNVDNEPIEVVEPMIVWLLVWLVIWLYGLLHRFVGNVKAPVDKYDIEVLGRLAHNTNVDKRFENTYICKVSGKPSQKSTLIVRDETIYYPEAVPGVIKSLKKSNYEIKVNNISCDNL